MENRKFLTILGIILIIGTGGLIFWQTRLQDESYPAPTGRLPSDISGAAKPITEKVRRITAAEVAAHNLKNDCWSIINGSVYDLTAWIPKHPGGEEAIIQLCGIDGSKQFNDKHGKSKKVGLILSGFKIGELAE